MFNLVSIDPCENNSTQIRIVESFERIEDALIVLKALESVNILFHCYGIMNDIDLATYKEVSFYCYITEKEISFVNKMFKKENEKE